jgi:hypothetical protein
MHVQDILGRQTTHIDKHEIGRLKIFYLVEFVTKIDWIDEIALQIRKHDNLQG